MALQTIGYSIDRLLFIRHPIQHVGHHQCLRGKPRSTPHRYPAHPEVNALSPASASDHGGHPGHGLWFWKLTGLMSFQHPDNPEVHRTASSGLPNHQRHALHPAAHHGLVPLGHRRLWSITYPSGNVFVTNNGGSMSFTPQGGGLYKAPCWQGRKRCPLHKPVFRRQRPDGTPSTN